MLISLFAEPVLLNIHSVDFRAYRLNLFENVYFFCPCADAELFSAEILKHLLVSQSGEQISAAFAVSFSDEKMTIKMITL